MGRQYTLIFFCAQNKLVSNTVQIIFCHYILIFYTHFYRFLSTVPLYAHFPKIFAPILFLLRIMHHYIFAAVHPWQSCWLNFFFFFSCCIRGWNLAENKPSCIPPGTQRSEWLGMAGLPFWLWPIWHCKSGFIPWGLHSCWFMSSVVYWSNRLCRFRISVAKCTYSVSTKYTEASD